MADGRNNHQCGLVQRDDGAGKEIIVIGGDFPPWGAGTNTIEAYSVATGTWRPLPGLFNAIAVKTVQSGRSFRVRNIKVINSK